MAKMDKKSTKNKKNTNMLLAAFMIFIFPIIGIFAGVLLGGIIVGSTNLGKIIGGIAGFILAGMVIKLFDKSSKVANDIEKIHWDDL